MSLQVTGKGINVGESFQTYVAEKLDGAIGKYLGSYLAAHVRVEKERGRFHTSCSVRVRTGLVLESTGEGTDAYASADAAFEHLEKRLRRYKRRLKNRHHGVTSDAGDSPEELGEQINDFVVEVPDRVEPAGKPGKTPVDDGPLIVAETARTLHELPVSEAVMRLDLTDDAFLVFRNAASGEINVVYRRADGNIGWIDASVATGGGARGANASGARSAGAMAGGKPSTRQSARQSVGGRSKRSS